MAAGVIVVALAGAIALAGCSALQTAAAHTAMAAPAARARASGAADGVGERVFTFIDHSRLVRIPGQGLQPRKLVTVVRYPLHASGPVGLIVFGHGFAVTPASSSGCSRRGRRRDRRRGRPSSRLAIACTRRPERVRHRCEPATRHELRHFANAGGQRTAPGSARRAIDPNKIAVSGQSDGVETALAVAYDRAYRDPRVRAAIILSGDDGLGGTYFAPGSPPLLAAQGTADHINQPRYAYAFFAAARRPKFLLS